MRARTPSLLDARLVASLVVLAAGRLAAQNSAGAVVVLEAAGQVEVQRAGSVRWDPAHTNQVLDAGDWVRTRERSRALLRFSELDLFRVDERSQIQIPPLARKRRIFDSLRGVFYFFHRGEPGEVELRSRLINSVVRGTEFNLAVAEDGATVLSVLDGEVEMSNSSGRITLHGGEEGRVEAGQPPSRRVGLEAVNIIQWCLYYAAVLDPAELNLGHDGYRDSLAAYGQGDLLSALAHYPAKREPATAEEKIYLAQLLLAVGRVDEAGQLQDQVAASTSADSRPARLAAALRRLISATKRQAGERASPPRLASEFLAESYVQQSCSHLEAALAAAQQAVAISTNFAFGWARVAELEFSLGRVPAARAALERSLQLAPRNAQAVALQGFLFAAQNRIAAALAAFDQALALDGALGNAWLGRGLCRIRQGRGEEGRMDLQAAAAVEPQRAVLRSYLGKAFGQTYDPARAVKELALARQLDPADPTPWLYSALLQQQENRINEAVRDLERSQALNDNRSIYRSRLLLDQDQAVRGANLATLYQDAGMTDPSVREASRAVSLDYANYSAHLFLGNSYNALRDPRQINLRYETPWLSEYLLANLLAPAGAGTLSPFVTQQEYARLFERDRVGLSSSTEYGSRGDWYQTAVQHGNFGRFGYAAEVAYRSENGHRPNNDLEQLTPTLKLKYEITPQDRVFLQGTYYEAETGDVNPYYDESKANRSLRTKETQKPLLLAGYHHQWSPGVDTLLLAGHGQDTFKVSDTQQVTLVLVKLPGNGLGAAGPIAVEQDYRSDVEIYTAELQQIFQQHRNTLLFGGRFQAGDFDAVNRPLITRAGLPPGFAPEQFDSSPTRADSDFERVTAYGYDYWQALDSLTLIAGVSYDRVTAPVNFRYAPLASGEDAVERVSPKAGLVWTPLTNTTVRLAYSRALGGVAFDQSFQLEPSQLAGFNQAYRSLIPESVRGANSSPKFEIVGAALDQKFAHGTYAGVTFDWLRSRVDRVFGVYDDQLLTSNGPVTLPYIFPSGTRQRLDYDERTLTASVNQLLGDEWAVGARYRFSQADLKDDFGDIPANTPGPPGFRSKQDLSATLQQLNLYALYTHPCGFFGQAEALWNIQRNQGYEPDLPGDDFWQFNAYVGYRFPHRRAEVRLGLLNLTDRDYRLNPLNLTGELPHDRTVVVNFRFSF